MRVSVFLLTCVAFTTLLLASAALAAPDAPANEPSAPQPTPAVQKLLDEAAHKIEAKEQPQALKVAGDALAAARAAGDGAGQAQAEEVRARALEAAGPAQEAAA